MNATQSADGRRALMIYLDSAAAVKLVHSEVHSEALRDWLGERAAEGWVSSVVLQVECFRALARHAPDAISRLHPLLDLIDLIALDAGTRITAQTVAPVAVRSLDAIHVATALRSPEHLSSFVTYDKRLADTARLAGLPVDMPV